MNYSIAEVAIPLAIDKVFDYKIPEEWGELVRVGKRVFVPFGNKKTTGFVVGLKQSSGVSVLKDIEDILDTQPVFDENMLDLCRWMSQYYVCSLGEALQAALPGLGDWEEKTIISLNKDKVKVQEAKSPRQTRCLTRLPLSGNALLQRRSKPNELIDLLIEKKKVTVGQIKKALKWKNPTAFLAQMEKQGIITIQQKVEKKKGISGAPTDVRVEESRQTEKFTFVLTPEQKQAMAVLEPKMVEQKFGVTLLQGVTGSGKTEVYLRCASFMKSLGRQSLILVPEISLTPQTMDHFKSIFGDSVATLHSRLTQKESLAEWSKIKSGQAWVVVGPRSAVFAPLDKLGLIVIDEEQETSYKQGETPRYHCRSVALMRAKQNQALVLLGSATPSLESRYYAEKKEYGHIVFKKRILDRPLAQVKVVDMRTELKQANKTLLISSELKNKLSQCINNGEQALLFLNRRGFSTIVLCVECGYAFRCPACSVAMTYHLGINRLKCHYCLYETTLPQVCPMCSSKKIEKYGVGVQQVEAEARAMFPKVGVDRMDVDATTKKNAHREILGRFKEGRTKILVGTQMIAKGLDFPGVTLVGVISSDTSLNFPDFRSGERTFQLLTQVAGRAGRGQKPGEVIIQTFVPDHYAIQAAKSQDYDAFYQKELKYRQELGYPPFSRMAQVIFKSTDLEMLQKASLDFRKDLERALAAKKTASVKILGPAPCVIEKIKGFYRWQMLIRGAKRQEFAAFCQSELKLAKNKFELGRVLISIDVDPMGMA